MKTIIKFFTINAQLFAITVLVLLVGFSSCKKDDNITGTISYSGSFIKSGNLVVTSASGTVTAKYDPTTMSLSYKLTWSGLGSNAASMHFHDAGPVIVNIDGFAAATSGTVSGTATLTSKQATDLASGKIYAQIHTLNIPSGEIKATLSKNSNSNNYTSGGSYNY
jgi:hypothetical protein